MLPGNSPRRRARAGSMPTLTAALALVTLAALPAPALAQSAAALGTAISGGTPSDPANAAAPVTHTIELQTAGSGSGTITTSPACGSPCTFEDGTVVLLTATPDAGSTFGGWSAPCDAASFCYLPVTSDLSLSATFTRSAVPTYTLTVAGTGTGGGTVVASAGGIYCTPYLTGELACAGAIPGGTAVTLTARPYDSTFDGWSGPCTGSQLTCSFVLTGDETVGARFTDLPIPTRTLTTSKVGTGTGSVTPDCTSPCSYRDGAIVHLTVTPDPGSTFDGMELYQSSGADGSMYGCGNASGYYSCQVSLIGGSAVVGFRFTAKATPATPCADPVDFTNSTANFDTTGARCYRTAALVRGWGCSSFAGRTVSVNGGAAASACGAGPFPLPRAADGYTYFSITAGQYPWATLYAWTW